jgi:hypothetical protein
VLTHRQRSPDWAEAEEPPLMFRSGKIAHVLAYLAKQLAFSIFRRSRRMR